MSSQGKLLEWGGLRGREAIPLFVAFLLNPQAWGRWKRALAPCPAEQSCGADTSPESLQPSSFFSPVFVLAESCWGLWKADSIKANGRSQDTESQRRELKGASDRDTEVVAQWVDGRPQ